MGKIGDFFNNIKNKIFKNIPKLEEPNLTESVYSNR